MMTAFFHVLRFILFSMIFLTLGTHAKGGMSPLTEQFTLSDAIQLATFIYIIISIILNIMENVLARHGRISQNRIFSYTTLIGSITSYITFIGYFLIRAIYS